MTTNKLQVPKNYFHIHSKVLLWLGIDIIPIENYYKRLAYYVYAFFSLGLMCYIFLVVEWADLLLDITNMEKLTFGLSYAFTHLLGMVKVSLLLKKRRSMWKLMKKLTTGIFAPDINRAGEKEFELINQAIKSSDNQGYAFYILAFGIISLRGVYAATSSGITLEIFFEQHNTTEYKHINTMPYTSWFPFDINKQPMYAIGFIYQLMSTMAYGLYIGAADAVLCGFMIHIKAQFDILKLSLDNLIERAKKNLNESKAKTMLEDSTKLPDIYETVHLLSKDMNEEIDPLVKKVVLHHQEILQLSLEIEDEICYLMLLQFISSLFIICFQLFQISLVNPLSSEFGSMCLYFILMMFQLLNYCYRGNAVMYASDNLSRYIFDIDWIILSEDAKTSLLLMMMRAQRSTKFTAGKFALLSLQTYMTIVKGSGSYFMFLKQMNK